MGGQENHLRFLKMGRPTSYPSPTDDKADKALVGLCEVKTAETSISRSACAIVKYIRQWSDLFCHEPFAPKIASCIIGRIIDKAELNTSRDVSDVAH